MTFMADPTTPALAPSYNALRDALIVLADENERLRDLLIRFQASSQDLAAAALALVTCARGSFDCIDAALASYLPPQP